MGLRHGHRRQGPAGLRPGTWARTSTPPRSPSTTRCTGRCAPPSRSRPRRARWPDLPDRHQLQALRPGRGRRPTRRRARCRAAPTPTATTTPCGPRPCWATASSPTRTYSLTGKPLQYALRLHRERGEEDLGHQHLPVGHPAPGHLPRRPPGRRRSRPAQHLPLRRGGQRPVRLRRLPRRHRHPVLRLRLPAPPDRSLGRRRHHLRHRPSAGAARRPGAVLALLHLRQGRQPQDRNPSRPHRRQRQGHQAHLRRTRPPAPASRTRSPRSHQPGPPALEEQLRLRRHRQHHRPVLIGGDTQKLDWDAEGHLAKVTEPVEGKADESPSTSTTPTATA